MVKERIRRRELVITQIIPHRAKAVKRERRRGTPRSRFAVREDGERRGATGSYGGRPFRPPTRTNPNPVKGNCVWEGRWALYIRAKRIAIVFGTALVEGENSSTKNTRLFSHRLREGKPLVGERANQKARIGDYADNPAPSKGS